MTVTIQEINVFDDNIRWQGVELIMSDSTKNVTCKISSAQNCCERFGIHKICHLHNTISPGKLDDFIGATYHSVNIKKTQKHEVDFLTIVEITIHTDRGKIIIQLYNEHNGFYQHDFFTQTEHGSKINSF